MKDCISLADEFVGSTDVQRISGREFYGVKFEGFDIRASIPWDKREFDPFPWLKRMEIIDTSFINCRLVLEIRTAVMIKNVIIESMRRYKNNLTISAEALLDNLVIKGKTDLWIKPDEPERQRSENIEYQRRVREWLSESRKNIDCFLDITGIESGDVAIYGIPIEKIRFDKARMIPIYSEWNETVDWKSPQIHGFYWKSSIKQLRVYDVSCGLVNMPDKKNKHYNEAMEDFEYLSGIGLFK